MNLGRLEGLVCRFPATERQLFIRLVVLPLDHAAHIVALHANELLELGALDEGCEVVFTEVGEGHFEHVVEVRIDAALPRLGGLLTDSCGVTESQVRGSEGQRVRGSEGHRDGHRGRWEKIRGMMDGVISGYRSAFDT